MTSSSRFQRFLQAESSAAASATGLAIPHKALCHGRCVRGRVVDRFSLGAAGVGVAVVSTTNESLMQRRLAAVPRGVGQTHPIFVERAENATVIDVEGREYIDFAGGIAVLNTGHRSEEH